VARDDDAIARDPAEQVVNGARGVQQAVGRALGDGEEVRVSRAVALVVGIGDHVSVLQQLEQEEGVVDLGDIARGRIGARISRAVVAGPPGEDREAARRRRLGRDPDRAGHRDVARVNRGRVIEDPVDAGHAVG
jgi:hypothetical protein